MVLREIKQRRMARSGEHVLVTGRKAIADPHQPCRRRRTEWGFVAVGIGEQSVEARRTARAGQGRRLDE
jgi:hypothetical protein